MGVPAAAGLSYLENQADPALQGSDPAALR
jgi:hypothetical protein